MDRKIIEEIFKLGSDALYNTLNPDNGEVSDRYLELKEEAVKLFSIQLVSEMFYFAGYLYGNFEDFDNTEEHGCTFVKNSDSSIHTKDQIYKQWLDIRNSR